MRNVESIYPYTIVEENGLYGIADKGGNLIVPCFMDEITNSKDEETGIDCWDDFFCVPVIKDGKYGFFTSNGKFIEPSYENFALDPFGGDIHVKTEDGFAVFAAPGYVFEEIPLAHSLFADLYPDYFEEDPEDLNFDMGENFCWKTWEGMGVGQDILSAVKERLRDFGYKYAEDLWNSSCYSDDKMEEFVHAMLSRLNDYDLIEDKLMDIKAVGADNEAIFWDMIEDKNCGDLLPWCMNMAMRGAASFISCKGMTQANIPLLNRKVDELLKGHGEDGYQSMFSLIDRLLPCPEHGSEEIMSIHFPAEKRPKCEYVFIGDVINGEIGEIYLYEYAMHMYGVSVNVYSSDDPEELLDENHMLDISDIILSDLLTCLQQVMDPTKENTELSEAIDKAIKVENGKSAIAQILTDCGIYLLSLSDYGRTPRFYNGYIAEDVDYIYVYHDDVMLVLDSCTPQVNIVPLEEKCGNYSWIVEDIKAAANIAFKKSKS